MAGKDQYGGLFGPYFSGDPVQEALQELQNIQRQIDYYSQPGMGTRPEYLKDLQARMIPYNDFLYSKGFQTGGTGATAGGISGAPGTTGASFIQGINEAQRPAQDKELESLINEYKGAYGNVRNAYTQRAQQAGTYSPTDQFAGGLDYATKEGAAGARTILLNRINSLRKATGQGEMSEKDFDLSGDKNPAPVQAQAPASPTQEPQAAPVQADFQNATGIDAPSNAVGTTLSSTGSTAMTKYDPTSTMQDSASGDTRIAALRKKISTFGQ